MNYFDRSLIILALVRNKNLHICNYFICFRCSYIRLDSFCYNGTSLGKLSTSTVSVVKA